MHSPTNEGTAERRRPEPVKHSPPSMLPAAAKKKTAHSADKSIAMLKAVLAGGSYRSVAARFGCSKSAVEQRVKALAHELDRVAGSTAEKAPSLVAMRHRREAYLAALVAYRPQPRRAREPRTGLNEEQITRLLALTAASSSQPRRDVALLLMLFATGAKPLEIARLEVRDYLNADGSSAARAGDAAPDDPTARRRGGGSPAVS